MACIQSQDSDSQRLAKKHRSSRLQSSEAQRACHEKAGLSTHEFHLQKLENGFNSKQTRLLLVDPTLLGWKRKNNNNTCNHVDKNKMYRLCIKNLWFF